MSSKLFGITILCLFGCKILFADPWTEGDSLILREDLTQRTPAAAQHTPLNEPEPACKIEMRNPSPFTYTLGSAVVTKYVWRGMEQVGGRPAFQPSVTVSHPTSGLSLNLWTSFAMAQRTEFNTLDEYDFTLTEARTVGPLDLSAGAIHYNYPRLKDEAGSRMWPNRVSTDIEAFATVACGAVPFKPTLSGYYAFYKESWSGTYVNLSGSYAVTSSSMPPLNVTFGLGYSDQTLVPKSEVSDLNLGLSTTLSYGSLSFVPSLALTWVPDKDIYSDQLVIWSGFAVTMQR